MNLDKLPLMSALAKKLSVLSQRQEVISQNVANANTPGYRARKIREDDFNRALNNSLNSPVKMAEGQTIRKTNSKHMNVTPSSNNEKLRVEFDENANDSSIDGNTVVLEEQMMEMAKTQMEYSTIVNLYRRHKGLLKTALGKPSR